MEKKTNYLINHIKVLSSDKLKLHDKKNYLLLMEYENNVIYSYDRFLVHLQNHMRQFLTKIHISYGDIVRDTEMGMLKGTTRPEF